MCVIKFLGRGSCILRWLRRRVGERLGELRALLGKLLTRRPKSVLGELFQASRGRGALGLLRHGSKVVLTDARLTGRNYTSLLRDSRFGLAPRGDGRWTWRLAELMQTGTIPVVLADGLRLPSSSPRDCLGSLTPRQLFHINLTLSQTIRCPAFSPLAAVSELTPGRADRVGQATSTTKARLE